MVGAKLLLEEFAVCRGGKTWRTIRIDAARQRLDHRFEIGVEEEWARVARPSGAIDHPVRRREETAVAPAMQHVGRVHDKAAGARRCVDPRTVGRLNLKATNFVLQKKRDETVVSMRG